MKSGIGSTSEHYSQRSASFGSMCVARRAHEHEYSRVSCKLGGRSEEVRCHRLVRAHIFTVAGDAGDGEPAVPYAHAAADGGAVAEEAPPKRLVDDDRVRGAFVVKGKNGSEGQDLDYWRCLPRVDQAAPALQRIAQRPPPRLIATASA